MLSLALSAYEHKKKNTRQPSCAPTQSSRKKIDKNQTVLIIAQKEEIMNNFEKLVIILLNIFVLVTLISMVLTGNNWESTGVHILCACSLGVNVLFAEYVICGGK